MTYRASMGKNEVAFSDGPAPRWPEGRVPWPAIALPLVIGFFQLVGSAGAADNQPDREPIDLVAVVLLLTGPVALTVRRRYPVAALVATMAATVLYLALGYPYGPVFLSLVIALVTAVMRGRRRAAWLTAAAGYVAWLASGPFVDDPPTFL
ncbi:MAG: hypothetical protein M3357_07610, partial [Actinomycetota bacterium]|nr:hypothetical protein [Actinomycetota bacterium]